MKRLSRDINPLLLMVIVSTVLVVIGAAIDVSNETLGLLGLAGVALVVIWTLPQADKPLEPRRSRARDSTP